MENIRNINLKDIKENFYVLENYKLQFYINGIYIDIYDKLNGLYNDNLFVKVFYKLFNDTKLNNLCNKNINEDIDENELYLIYYIYNLGKLCNIDYQENIQYNINKSHFINILINILTYYIFNFNKEKIKDYINILKNNIICSNIIEKDREHLLKREKDAFKMNLNKIYFNKNLLEDINKLNLNFEIIFYNLLPYNDSINDIIFNIDNYSMLYKLNNKDVIYNFSRNKNNNNIIYYSDLITYKEKLIINCNNNLLDLKNDDNIINNIKNNIDLLDNENIIDENKLLKDNNNKLLEINKELKDNIIDLEKQLNILKEENNDYKDKLNKLKIFLTNLKI